MHLCLFLFFSSGTRERKIGIKQTKTTVKRKMIREICDCVRGRKENTTGKKGEDGYDSYTGLGIRTSGFHSYFCNDLFSDLGKVTPPPLLQIPIYKMQIKILTCLPTS